MIFSGLHMMLRMVHEDKPNYSDVGLGFIIMGFCEIIMYLCITLIVKGLIIN